MEKIPMTKAGSIALEAELKKLKELLDLGVLTQEEYDKKANQLKSKILDN